MYIFTDEESQTCQEHTFSVFATNPAGDGAVATMEETIPICKYIAVFTVYGVCTEGALLIRTFTVEPLY